MSLSSSAEQFAGYNLRPFETQLAKLEGADAASPEALAFYSRYDGVRTHQFYFDRFWRLRGDGGSSLIEEASGRVDGNRAAAHNYLTHGLHPYKGKYFPQIVRSLLNIAGLPAGAAVVDPFVGSGTTSLEASLMGFGARGFDRNPLAALIARTKISALSLKADQVEEMACQLVSADGHPSFELPNRAYLEKWFPLETLLTIEQTLGRIQEAEIPEPMADVARLTLSSLLRGWSLQEPSQLRVHRRKEAPDADSLRRRFAAELLKAAKSVALSVRLLAELGIDPAPVVVAEADVREEAAWEGQCYSALITSPPYATALPYIDTDRLSIYALGLDSVERRSDLEWEMIGNREIGKRRKMELERRLDANDDDLPESIIADIDLIRKRNEAVGVGFRRENLPALLYRYFADMKRVFELGHSSLSRGALCGIVVGDSYTTAGEERFRIRTTDLLVELCEAIGFSTEERIPMGGQVAYLPHQKNGIQAEEILIFRRDMEP